MNHAEFLDAIAKRGHPNGIRAVDGKLTDFGDNLSSKSIVGDANGDGSGDGLPENAIAVFDAVITSSKEDRDRDILDVKGANVDPNMPLLWQHQREQPIGTFEGVTHRDGEKLAGRFAIANTELGRDALTLLKMGALRISHGFKVHDGKARKNGGFRIAAFEIMEVSLVSVPSNTDAVVTALNTGKLFSPQVKSWAGSFSNPTNPESKEGRQMTKQATDNTNNNPTAANKGEGNGSNQAAATLTAGDVKQIVQETIGEALKGIENPNGNGNASHNPPDSKTTPNDVFDMVDKANGGGGSGEGGNPRIRQKKASEWYETKRADAVHAKTGQPVHYNGRRISEPSDLQLAKMGAWFKHFQASNAKTLGDWGFSVPRLTDHDKQLLTEMVNEDRFCGKAPGDVWTDGAKIADLGMDVKSLLDDSTSGGSSLVPFDFDEAIVTYPVLNGELFPFIDVRETNSSEVRTGALTNPTVSWGTSEGSQISLFDTDSMIAAITADVHNVTIGITYGRDFAADSPVALGAILREQIGQVMLEELDDIIMNGDGSTQPEGILTASGTTSVNSDNAASGPWTLGDYETLMFSAAKQYRRRDWNPVFISNDTVYQRRTSIKIDTNSPTTDQRPVFGMTHNNYSTLGWPHKIQNSMGNRNCVFAALKKYRMWRRAGFEFRLVTECKELARKNENLLIARGRYAGELVDTNAAAVCADGQS